MEQLGNAGVSRAQKRGGASRPMGLRKTPTPLAPPAIQTTEDAEDTDKQQPARVLPQAVKALFGYRQAQVG